MASCYFHLIMVKLLYQFKIFHNLIKIYYKFAMADKLNKFKKLGKTFDKEFKQKSAELKPKKGLNPYKKKVRRRAIVDFLEEEE